MTLHRDLAAGRWWSMTLAEQMGNAGADVGRAIRAKSMGDRERFEPAFDRALELLDLTLADRRRSGPQLREIARMREVVCDYLVGDNEYASTPEWIEGYFMEFALASRRAR
jgi:hypothetical protein